jgi:hypothetical protein
MKTLVYSLVLLASALCVQANQPGPFPEPKISLPHALQLAEDYIKAKRIDVSKHYMDRIWIGYQEGFSDLRWIVSWSPKPDNLSGTTGWIILTVKMDGTVSNDEGAVPWISQKYIEWIRSLK